MDFITLPKRITQLHGAPCQHTQTRTTNILGFHAKVCALCGQMLGYITPITSAEANRQVQPRPPVRREIHPQQHESEPMIASDFLTLAGKHMNDRAATYNAPEGERSMAKTVEMFNTLKGTELSATDGWEFMMLLKLVRANQGDFKSDNYEDLTAYAALAGEEASQAHQASLKH